MCNCECSFNVLGYNVPVPYYGNSTGSDLNLAVWEKVVNAHSETAGYDGWYNNRAHPEWGAAGL